MKEKNKKIISLQDYKNKIQWEKDISPKRKGLSTTHQIKETKGEESMNINERFLHIKQKIDHIQKLLNGLQKL